MSSSSGGGGGGTGAESVRAAGAGWTDSMSTVEGGGWAVKRDVKYNYTEYVGQVQSFGEVFNSAIILAKIFKNHQI